MAQEDSGPRSPGSASANTESDVRSPGRSYKYAFMIVFEVLMIAAYSALVRYGAPNGGRGFEATHVMIFVGFAFLMTFLQKYCYTALGFNMLVAAMVIQWALLINSILITDETLSITVNVRQLLEADIQAVSILITFGCLLGFASCIQMMFIALVQTVLGCVNVYVIMEKFKAADSGGSIAIHMFGALFGLACSFGLNLRRGKSFRGLEHEDNSSTYNSDIFAILGSLFLWIYWPTFNSAFVMTQTEHERCIVNTYLSLGAATVTTFMTSSMLGTDEGRFHMVHIQNSPLAGGVAVGAVANMYVYPGGAVAVGVVCAIISVVGFKFITPALARKGIKDTCGVLNLHGFPGIISGFLSILLAAIANKAVYQEDLISVFPAMEDKASIDDPTIIIKGRTAMNQALFQLAAVGLSMGISLIGGIITGLTASMKCFSPLEEKDLYNDDINWKLPETQ